MQGTARSATSGLVTWYHDSLYTLQDTAPLSIAFYVDNYHFLDLFDPAMIPSTPCLRLPRCNIGNRGGDSCHGLISLVILRMIIPWT